VTGTDRRRSPRRFLGRAGLAAAVWLTAILPVSAQSTPTAKPPALTVVQELVRAVLPQLPPAPLFVGLAQVIVPPGGRTDAANTDGPRLLAVEAGTLTVATSAAAQVLRIAGNGGWGSREAVAAGSDVVLDPGDRLILPPNAVREVRNDGAHPSVFLDAALFPVGPRPVAVAFTTDEGISFQLLAGVVAEVVPEPPVEFVLARIKLPRDGDLPAEPRQGPAVAYVEAGSLGLVPTAGEVRYSRAAAPAPYSTAGAMKPVPLGRKIPLTAGASAFLPTGSAISARNERDVPATILVVEIRPVSVGPATKTGLG
jgi:hypothetical protein